MDDADKFWNDFETETGEKVAARSMGIWHENGDEKGLWGIVILTDASFRFKYLPSESLILGLFKSPGGGKGEKRGAVDIVVPLDQVTSLKEAERSFLSRLFGSPFRSVEVSWGASEADHRRERFSVDPSGDLLKRLRQSLPGLAG